MQIRSLSKGKCVPNAARMDGLSKGISSRDSNNAPGIDEYLEEVQCLLQLIEVIVYCWKLVEGANVYHENHVRRVFEAIYPFHALVHLTANIHKPAMKAETNKDLTESSRLRFIPCIHNSRANGIVYFVSLLVDLSCGALHTADIFFIGKVITRRYSLEFVQETGRAGIRGLKRKKAKLESDENITVCDQ